MSIPVGAFKVRGDGRQARLRLSDLPMPDTFQFANNVSVSGQIGLDVLWKATGTPVERGNGSTVDPTDPSAFLGTFSEATCTARGNGSSTGFNFVTNDLTEEGFYADLGRERNGVFL